MNVPERNGSYVIQFRSGDLLPLLEARSSDAISVNVAAKRDLDRYYTLLGDAMAGLRGIFTLEEGAVVMQACRNFTVDGGGPWRLLWAQVADSQEVCETWGVDRDALVAKVRNLSLVSVAALVDAAERLWGQTSGDMDKRLREVGLL